MINVSFIPKIISKLRKDYVSLGYLVNDGGVGVHNNVLVDKTVL